MLKCTTWVLLLLLVAVSRAEEPAGNTGLQGRWVAVAGERDGKAISKKQIASMALEVNGKCLRRVGSGLAVWRGDLRGPKGEAEVLDTSASLLNFKVNPAKTPKELDVEISWCGFQTYSSHTCDGKTEEKRWRVGYPVYEKSIYALQDDRLQICWGGNKRPTSFATKPEDDFTLIVYKRPEQNGNSAKNAPACASE